MIYAADERYVAGVSGLCVLAPVFLSDRARSIVERRRRLEPCLNSTRCSTPAREALVPGSSRAGAWHGRFCGECRPVVLRWPASEPSAGVTPRPTELWSVSILTAAEVPLCEGPAGPGLQVTFKSQHFLLGRKLDGDTGDHGR